MKHITYLNIILISLLTLTCLTGFGADTRKKIIIVDTGINETSHIKPYLCTEGSKDFTEKGLNDNHGHGTHIAYLIARGMNNKKQCLVIVKWFDKNKTEMKSLIDAMEYASKIESILINLSLGGGSPSDKEKEYIESMLEKGTQVVVSAGNEGRNSDEYCGSYPACYKFTKKYKNLHIVGNGMGEDLWLKRRDERKFKNSCRLPVVLGRQAYSMACTSNYGSNLTEIVNGYEITVKINGNKVTYTGTSQSAAIVSAYLVKRMK